MDPEVAWLSPEQQGPSSEVFTRVWRCHQEFQRLGVSSRLKLGVPDIIDHCQPASAGSGAAPPPPTAPLGAPAAPAASQPRGRRPEATRDRSCTADFDERKTELVGTYGGCPWLMPNKVYSTGVTGLHEEIEDFFLYMSPTREEHRMRTHVYTAIRSVIQRLWHNAEVHIFGSFETGLYLPTSDIDLVVMGNWENSLEMLREALVRADICDPAAIRVLDKAAVPIIKLTDRRTEVKVDISFNMNNGLISANQIKQYQVEFPHMPKLVITLKQFLLQRELNEVFTGGISSYSLILMTVAFLQTHERKLSSYPDCNLGLLLIEFFEMYGVKFNYLKTCIKVKDRGFAPRSEVEQQFAQTVSHNSPLCIEDPHNASNDIGRSSYNMMKVKEAFMYAYKRLSSAVFSHEVMCDPNRHSILGRVLRVADRVVEYRRSIRAQFPVTVVAAPPLPHAVSLPPLPPAPPVAAVPQRAASYSPRSSSSPLSSATSDASEPDGSVETSDSAAPAPAAGRRDAALPSRALSPAGSRRPPPPAPHHQRSGSGSGSGRRGHGLTNGAAPAGGHLYSGGGQLPQTAGRHRRQPSRPGDAAAVGGGAGRAPRHQSSRGSQRERPAAGSGSGSGGSGS